MFGRFRHALTNRSGEWQSGASREVDVWMSLITSASVLFQRLLLFLYIREFNFEVQL